VSGGKGKNGRQEESAPWGAGRGLSPVNARRPDFLRIRSHCVYTTGVKDDQQQGHAEVNRSHPQQKGQKRILTGGAGAAAAMMGASAVLKLSGWPAYGGTAGTEEVVEAKAPAGADPQPGAEDNSFLSRQRGPNENEKAGQNLSAEMATRRVADYFGPWNWAAPPNKRLRTPQK